MEDESGIRTVDRDILGRWLAEGRPVTILDVRPLDQRKEWSIPGSVHADAYAALKGGDAKALEGVALPGDRPVVAVCAAGRMSRKAAEILGRQGFEAYSLEGGMQAWSGAWNQAEIPFDVAGARLIQVRRAGKGCLSYLLMSEGEAAVVDASVDPGVYLGLARQAGARITAVLDTHVHADHFSRASALRALCGLREEGDAVSLRVGAVAVETLATPGHTPESRCFLLGGKALCTGDTLFLNSVGRPDLLPDSDPAEQAKVLYRSIQRLATLPEEVTILPAHHPEPPAFDGVPLAATLGELRVRNPYLRAAEAEFLALVSAGTAAPPPNFAAIVAANRSGRLPEGDWQALEAGPNRCARA